ncbi:MAG TPA: hypothetical protein VKE25_07005, partial [Actinomycetes bacterium]|nr:hypothetical protein [Actinomycetes bacterium]
MTGRAIPSVQCAGSAGWTRDGWFVCIPASGLPLTRYSIGESGGLSGTEIGRASSGNRSGDITPELLGQNATALLGSADDPNAIRISSVAAGPTATIFYPGATSVTPLEWCGPDTVLVAADGNLSVLDLDDGVRSRFPRPSTYGVLGCRPDGSMLLRVGDQLGKAVLIRPDGSIAGEFTVDTGRSETSTPAVDAAIDAFDWRLGGSAAHVPGFRPL